MGSKNKSRFRGLRRLKQALNDPRWHGRSREVICGDASCKKKYYIPANTKAEDFCPECKERRKKTE